MELPSKPGLVNPPSAVGRKKRARRTLGVVAAFLAASLGAAWSLGLVSPLGVLFLTVVVSAALLFLWQQASAAVQTIDADADEMRLLQRDSMLLDSLPQPVMLLTAKDHVETANAACRALFGDEAVGNHIAGVIRAPTALAALREARHMHKAREAEITISGPNSFSALFHVAPVDRTPGTTEGEYIVMIRDRTEQKKLERMRTDFIANAGHELRTPLAAILGFIETLQGHAKDDPEAREKFLRIMQSQTERLLRLVKDLVSLSALELNERRLPQDEVDLCEVTQTVRELMTPVAVKANGVIEPGHRDCQALIMGDRDQLIQVVQNLVDNALKYGSGDDGTQVRVEVSVGTGAKPAFADASKSGDSPQQIAVRADCRPDELLFLRVRDHGPGINPTDLPRLTERFYRTDVERSHAKGGTGLGLAIVKHIVGRHRGGILVESKKDAGAAFTCYFPPLHAHDDLPAVEQ